jgi:hypothetical protein
MNTIFLDEETKSDKVYSDDFESVHISQFQFYFLMMNNQNILKVFKIIFYALFLMTKENV